MSGYELVMGSARDSAVAALAGLPPEFLTALAEAGVRDPGTLAELLELEEHEFVLTFELLAEGTEVVSIEEFKAALRGCVAPAKRPEAVWT